MLVFIDKHVLIGRTIPQTEREGQDISSQRVSFLYRQEARGFYEGNALISSHAGERRASCGEKCRVWFTKAPGLMTALMRLAQGPWGACHFWLVCYTTEPRGDKEEVTFLK